MCTNGWKRTLDTMVLLANLLSPGTRLTMTDDDNYIPTVDLANLSNSWGVQFDSDAIGPTEVNTAGLLSSSKTVAHVDLTNPNASSGGDGSDKAFGAVAKVI